MVLWLSPTLQWSCQCDCYWIALPTLGQPTNHLGTSVWDTLGIPRYRCPCGRELLQEPGWWYMALVFHWGSSHAIRLLLCRRSRVSSRWEHFYWCCRNKHSLWSGFWKPHTRFKQCFSIAPVYSPHAVNDFLIWVISMRHNMKKHRV